MIVATSARVSSGLPESEVHDLIGDRDVVGPLRRVGERGVLLLEIGLRHRPGVSAAPSYVEANATSNQLAQHVSDIGEGHRNH